MSRLTFLFLLLLITAAITRPAIAQAPLLKGQVLDAKTRQPVPYASLQLRAGRTGILSNAQGHFEMAAPETAVADTLVVAGLNYKSHLVPLAARRLADSTLTLEKLELALQPMILIGGKVSLRQLGSRAKQPGQGMIQGLLGSQYALLMQPPPKQKLGSIRTVSFFIGENGYPKEPFRIRIYRADGPNHFPGTNLLTENIVVEAPRGGQWFTVDITEYNVDAAREGFFVAMEWLFGAGYIFSYPNFEDSSSIYGQVMRPTYEFKESLTWNYTPGKGWTLLTLANGQGRRYNAMIKAEVEVIR